MTHAEPTSASVFDSTDLAFFDNVLDNLVEEVAATGGMPPTNGSREDLKRELGARLFQCARAGERDHDDLKQRVLEAMRLERSDARSRPPA